MLDVKEIQTGLAGGFLAVKNVRRNDVVTGKTLKIQALFVAKRSLRQQQ